MLTLIQIVHVLLCAFMIFVILLQPGKDAGIGGGLGGGAATTAFGGRGAVTFLAKLTAGCATAFFLTSLGLSFVGVRTSVASTIPKRPVPSASADAGVVSPLDAGIGAGIDAGTTGDSTGVDAGS